MLGRRLPGLPSSRTSLASPPRTSPRTNLTESYYLADHIPGARLVELPGADVSIIWETPELVLDQVEEFLTGVRRIAEPTRVLAAVLFTDIVGSTEQAARVGDRRWRQLLDLHDELAARLVQEAGGRLVKTTGDGILATFDGPARGIRCAAELRGERAAWGSSSGRESMPARSSCATVTSAASPCTSRPGSWRRPDRVTSLPPGPSATWWSAPTSSWRTAVHIH